MVAAGFDNDGDKEEDIDYPQPEISSDFSKIEPGFVASKCWFEKFQKRFGLGSVPLYGETSADTPAAQSYVEEEFSQVVGESGYLPKQVFYMD